MLPLLLRLDENIFNKIHISADRWTELKPFVTFRKVQREEEIEVIGQYIVLIEGTLET